MSREGVASSTVGEEGISKAGTTVKEGVIGSLKGIAEIEAEIVSLVKNDEIPRFTRNENLKRRRLRGLIVRAEDQRVEPWHLMEATDVLEIFRTSKRYGLTSASAKENLKRYGPNFLPKSVRRSGSGIFIDQFKSLPVALLGVAAGISILTGGLANAIVIMGVVTINAAIGYITESQ